MENLKCMFLFFLLTSLCTAQTGFYIATTHCTDPAHFITTEAACKAAAQSLGLVDTTVSATSSVHVPYGCYYRAEEENSDELGHLWFNALGEAPKDSDDELRPSVCAQETSYTFYQGAPACSHEAHLINSSDLCAAAAQNLGLQDTSVASTNTEHVPFGCYYRDEDQNNDDLGHLWFNPHDSAPKVNEEEFRPSLCAIPTVGEYYLSSMGHCLNEESFITSVEECETAATALNLEDTSAAEFESEEQPYGCYYRADASNNKLWLNTDDETSLTNSGTLRRSVCKALSVHTPSPTTTTETPDQEDDSAAPSAAPTSVATGEPTAGTSEPTLATSEPTAATSEPTEAQPTSTTESASVTASPTTVVVSETSTTEESVTSEPTSTTAMPTEAQQPSTTADSSSTDSPTTVSTDTTSLETTTESMTSTPEPAEYSLSSVGRCLTLESVVVTLEECEAAADFLGLDDTTVEEITNVDRPFGCYFKDSAEDNKLWLNTHVNATLDNNSRRQSICYGTDSAIVDSGVGVLSAMLGLVFAMLLL